MARQTVQRSYQSDVVEPLLQLFAPSGDPDLQACAECFSYGSLDYRAEGFGTYRLYAVKSRHWNPAKPFFLVTGGVHGYETSGVLGGLCFLAERFTHYAERANLLHLVCVSPWGYETINRWNPHAVDPNRAFFPTPAAPEAKNAIDLLDQFGPPLLHIDLHETTDTDASEFRLAKAARDATPLEPCDVPDGFYLFADQNRPQPAFQAAIIDSVSRLTHIAPADAQGELLGKPLVQHGVIQSFKRQQGICSGWTEARYVTTTEVYPDSPRLNPQLCIDVQLTALCAGFDFVLDTALKTEALAGSPRTI
ncbi:MAG: peptidase [Hydrogenophaga sp.]|nr:peptidase [Hydrogenophaga sp.]